MGSIRYLTAGESHGKGLTTIVEGIPSNLKLTADFINRELARRQKGYGRGGRMKIEADAVKILSGVRFGSTIGSPVTLFIENKDWENWQEIMSSEFRVQSSEGLELKTQNSKLKTQNLPVTRPRPGHADLSGAIKYNQKDIRNILERSSARETAARVGVGAVAKRLLEEFEIKVFSWVTEIGGVKIPESVNSGQGAGNTEMLNKLFEKAETSEVRCIDNESSEAMKKRIDEARNNGDSVGGIFEVVVCGAPVGLGSHVHWDKKLNARLCMALMSIQAIKGVEVGLGFEAARRPGSLVHDEISYDKNKGFFRISNNAGGIEGGMSNGEDIVLRAAMKPIPTLYKPLQSVDIETKEVFEASIERSDICAVPAASVVGEAVVAIEIANALLDKFGGDSMEEMKRNYQAYSDYVKRF